MQGFVFVGMVLTWCLNQRVHEKKFCSYRTNMAEYCESSGDKCFYVPSRRWATPSESQWECRTQYANARLADWPDWVTILSCDDHSRILISTNFSVCAQGQCARIECRD